MEIYHDGKWGTVCDDYWDISDARVVCRSLGFRDAFTATKDAYFGEGSGEVWLDNVECDGTETRLQECTHRGWGKDDCSHNEDAGVICTNSDHQGIYFVNLFVIIIIIIIIIANIVIPR